MRVRTLCIIAAVTWLIPIGGCDMTGAERVAALETAVTTLQAQSGQIDTAIAAMETFLADSEVLLAEPNLPAGDIERIAAAVVAASAKLESAKAVKARVDAALADLQAQLAAAGEVTGPGAELQLIGGAVSTIGAHAPPPIGVYASLAGGLITAIGGVLVGMKKARTANAKADDLGQALDEVVAGGQEFKRRVKDQEAIIGTYKAAMGAKQSPATRNMVAVAKVGI